MDMIFNLLGFASLGAILVDFIDTIDTNQKLPQKPFKCALCLGYWYSVIPLVGMYGFRGFLLAGIVGLLTEIIDRYLNKQ